MTLPAFQQVEARWPRLRTWATQASTECLDQFLQGLRPIKIPHYQRGQVWTDAQKLAFGHNFLRGYNPAPVVLWQPDYTRDMALLDGYQRLSTLGVPLVDEAGQPIGTRPILMDVLGLELTMEPGPWRYSMAELAREPWKRSEAPMSPADSAYWQRAVCAQRAAEARLTVLLIRCQNPADAMEQFRWLNSGGTLMDPAHLARLGGQ